MRQLKNEQLSLAVPKPSKEERRNHSPICDLKRKGQYIPLLEIEKALHYDCGSEELTKKEIRRARKAIERPRHVGQVALAALTVAAVPFIGLHTDTLITTTLFPDTQPEIHDIAAPQNKANSDSKTFFIDGFGKRNGSYFAESLTPAIQTFDDCGVEAVEYGNRSIDVDGITRKIAEEVENESITDVSLYGYSIGGLVALDVAIKLKQDYNIDVRTIYLDHTPMDADSVRAKQRSRAQAVLTVINVSDHLGIDIENSTFIRWMAGLAFHDLQSIDASVDLLEDQFLVTTTANTKDDFKTIGEFNGPKPTIDYLTSTDRGSDYMVDDARSEREVIDYTRADNIPAIISLVNHAIHSRPDLTIPEYIEAAKNSKDELAQDKKNAVTMYRIHSGQLNRFYSSYK